MSVSPFKERFSLAWLSPPVPSADENPIPPGAHPDASPPSTVNQVPAGWDAVLNSIGNQVLATLSAIPGKTSTLLNLASASNMRLEALLPVIQYLAGKGLVERVVEDPSGNDTYKVPQADQVPQATSPRRA